MSKSILKKKEKVASLTFHSLENRLKRLEKEGLDLDNHLYKHLHAESLSVSRELFEIKNQIHNYAN